MFNNFEKIIMKKKELYIILTIIVIAIVVNFSLSYQSAMACSMWDPDYNWATGECETPPPSGERSAEGAACYAYRCNGSRAKIGHDIDCVWAVVGSCTPEKCEDLYPFCW
jgi:hypothetical protein